MSDDELGLEEGAVLASAIELTSPTAKAFVDEHRAEFDEILSTLLLDRLADWYVDAQTSGDPGRGDEADRMAGVLAEHWVSGNETMRTAIATGFLEALPPPRRLEHQAVERLPAVLRDELRRMEEWRPST